MIYRLRPLPLLIGLIGLGVLTFGLVSGTLGFTARYVIDLQPFFIPHVLISAL